MYTKANIRKLRPHESARQRCQKRGCRKRAVYCFSSQTPVMQGIAFDYLCETHIARDFTVLTPPEHNVTSASTITFKAVRRG